MSTREQLAQRALEQRASAYAPYSKYRVGASILAGGQVYDGCNIENAAFGAAICAERVAAVQAAMAGHRTFDAIAIATVNSPPAAPCGICLQVLQEFSGAPSDLQVILVNESGEQSVHTLLELLPHGFGPGLP